MKFDVAIVGAGPAGLSAAMALGRIRRSVLVVDAGEPRNAGVRHMQNVLSRDGTPPDAFRAMAREELAAYDGVRFQAGRVVGVAGEAGAFTLTLADGTAVEAARLVLTGGVKDELPAIPGLRDFWPHHVFLCPFCHGWEVRDRPIAIVNGTPAAAHVAGMVSRLSKQVTVLTDGAPAPEGEVLAKLGVPVDTRAIAAFEGEGEALRGIRFADGGFLAVEAAFVSSVFRQPEPLAALIGCNLFPDGTTEVDDFQRTSVPGVYAAGDAARRAAFPGPMATVVQAMASGQLAGISAHADQATLELH